MMHRSFFFFLPFLIVMSYGLTATNVNEGTGNDIFTGTLLASFGDNTPAGEATLASYLYYTRQMGFYDKNSHLDKDRNIHLIQSLLLIELGLLENVDINTEVYFTYVYGDEARSFGYGDTSFYFGFQLLRQNKKAPYPSVRVLLGENIPTGKYQNLEGILNGSDATGSGAFETFVTLVLKKVYNTWPKHPYNWNINFTMLLSQETKVEGFSFFGGDELSDGRLDPGIIYIVNLAFEYKFNRPWGCGFDLNYQHQNRATFRQNDPASTFTSIPSSENLNMTASLEYNLSSKISFVGGIWFSLYGRNTIAFTSGVLNFNYSF